MITKSWAIAQLRLGALSIQHSVEGLDDDIVSFQPRPGVWSIHQVLCHLLYEERDDFRVRLDYTLHRSSDEWPPNDPEGSVEAHWQERPWRETSREFLKERERSIVWLQGLASWDLDVEHVHPRFGALSAGTLLASWIGHDRLHLRQITQRNWEYLERIAAPHLLKYAGEW